MNRRAFTFLSLQVAMLNVVTNPLRLFAQTSSTPPSTRDADNHLSPRSSANIAWLKKYDGKSTSSLLDDVRLRAFLSKHFPNTQMAFWGNTSVPDAAYQFLSVPQKVSVEHNRFVKVTGCLSHFGRSRAMLWIDTHSHGDNPGPTVALVVIDVRGKSGANLWFVSNKNFQNYAPSMVPHNLRLNMSRWIRVQRAKYEGKIRQVSIVDSSSRASQVDPGLLNVPQHRFQLMADN